jgi:hypothetical protein
MLVRKNIFQWVVVLLCFVVIIGCSGSGKVLDDLYPYFVIVQWGSCPMILKLLFPETGKS